MRKSFLFINLYLVIGVIIGYGFRYFYEQHKEDKNWEMKWAYHWCLEDKAYYRNLWERERHLTQYNESKYDFLMTHGHKGRKEFEIYIRNNK